MVLTADQLRVKALLTETITLLCKNGLHFKREFAIEGLIGITLDGDDVFLVSINETVRTQFESAATSSDTLHPNRTDASSVAAPPPPRRNGQKRRRMSSSTGVAERRDDRAAEERSVWKKRSSPSSSSPATRGDHRESNIKSEKTGTDDESSNDAYCDDSALIVTCVAEEQESKDTTISENDARELSTNRTSEPAEIVPTSDRRSDGLNRRQLGRRRRRSDGSGDCEVIHVKEETLSDDDGDDKPTKNSFYGYENVYGAQNYGAATLAFDQPTGHEMNTTSATDAMATTGAVIPGCSSSTWNKRRSSRNSPHLQTVEFGSRSPIDSSNLSASWIRTVVDADDGDHSNRIVLGSPPNNRSYNEITAPPGVILEKQSRKYMCPYCGKTFSATNNLRGHLVHHTGIKEFVCAVCKKEFRYKQDLKRHAGKCQLHLISFG